MEHRHDIARERGAERAGAVMDAWSQRTVVEDITEPYAARTRHGEVVLERVTGHADDQGNRWVEVWVTGQVKGGDPHFRIFNPPTLVEDPAGPVEANGRRFREDPLAALAEVVAQHGGAQVAKTKRRV